MAGFVSVTVSARFSLLHSSLSSPIEPVFFSSRKPQGYYDDIERLRRELFQYLSEHPSLKVAENGPWRMPTQIELSQAKRTDLLNGIRKHGGIRRVARCFSLMLRRRNTRLWKLEKETEIQRFREELQTIAEECGISGYFPSERDLLRRHRCDLVGAIRAHGGFSVVADKVGLIPLRPRRQWYHRARMVDELEVFLKRNGMDRSRMPSRKNLLQEGRGDLVNAIQLHGGFHRVGAELGRTLEISRSARGRWNELKSVEKEIRELGESIGESGIMPSQATLQRYGKAHLIYAIRRHGGSTRLMNLWGLRPKNSRRSRNYWSNFTVLAGELNAYLHNFGYQNVMPRVEDLKSHGRMDLVYAIDRFGGISRVSQLLHLTWLGPSTYWREFSNVRKRLLGYLRTRPEGEQKIMPSFQQLHESGRLDLIQGIGFHGGVMQVARRVGKVQVAYPEYPENYFKDPKNLDREILSFLSTQRRELKKRMPTSVAFVKAGRLDLADAIRDNGGWIYYAQRLGLSFATETRHPRGYWADRKNVERELRNYLIERNLEHGMMPSVQQLERDGRSDIAFAIERYHSNAASFAESIGLRLQLDEVRLENAEFFDTWTNFVESMRQWIRENGIDGILPTRDELIRTGRHDLRNAVFRHGGGRLVGERLGLVHQEPGWIGRWLAHQVGTMYW